MTDLTQEPRHVLDLYGPDVHKPGTFAANCLLARRLAERGVRFIQLYHRDWDHHGNLKNDIKLKAEEVDKPTAALITYLKNRGMLDETLVIWGGEFGRTPMAQGNGRDHHIKGFSMFVCGGGISVTVTHAAFLGNRWRVEGSDARGGAFVIELPPHARVAAGDTIDLAVRGDSIHVLDA